MSAVKVVYAEASNFAELKGLEIFKTGTYYNDTYTAKELEEIVSATSELIKDGRHRAPGKLGHDEAQEYAKANGLGATGWVEKLWTDGKSIFADMKNVPLIVAKAIEAKLYDGVSCEIYSQTMSEQEFGLKKLVLRAIAFLGADVPKVKGMLSLSSALAMDDSKELALQGFVIKFAEGKIVLPFSDKQTPKPLVPGADAPKKENEKEDAMTAEEVTKLAERNATELAESNKRADAERVKREALENKVLESTFVAFFETHKEVIAPALHDRVKAMVKSFKADSVIKLGEKEVSAQETLLALIGEIATAKKIDLEESAEGETEDETSEGEVKALEESYVTGGIKVEGAALAVAVNKYMESHQGMKYGEALRIVSKDFKEAK